MRSRGQAALQDGAVQRLTYTVAALGLAAALVALLSVVAILGLGVRDYATAQYGACCRGGLPLPLRPALADHHAVGPGSFAAAGLRVVAGWGLINLDGAGAPRVALVDRTPAAAAVPSPGVGAYAAVATLLVAMALIASVRASREALAVEPMQSLE